MNFLKSQKEALWADARHYRFGASSLLASLLKALGHGDGKSASSY